MLAAADLVSLEFGQRGLEHLANRLLAASDFPALVHVLRVLGPEGHDAVQAALRMACSSALPRTSVRGASLPPPSWAMASTGRMERNAIPMSTPADNTPA